MVLTTNKLKNLEGNLLSGEGKSKLYRLYPPKAQISGGNDSKCYESAGNPCEVYDAVMMGFSSPGNTLRYSLCACLNNDNWNCQFMKYANGSTAKPVGKKNSGNFYSQPTFEPCDNNFWGDPPEYAVCSTKSTNLSDNGFYPTCSYPDNAIPSYDQAYLLYKDLNSDYSFTAPGDIYTSSYRTTDDEKALLYNYCFSKATNSSKCISPLTNCPNALSNDGSSVKNKAMCDALKNLEPQVYEDRMIEYCSNLYDTNKNNPDLSILQKSGCQCVFDLNKNPNSILKVIMEDADKPQAAHCVWQPCMSTSGNYVLKDDLLKNCSTTPIACASIVKMTGDASVSGTINQNISCVKATCDPPCKTDQKCDEAKGVCINLSQTTTPPTPPTPPTTTTFDILAFIKQQPLPVIIGGGSIIGVIIIIILYFMFANKPSQQTKL